MLHSELNNRWSGVLRHICSEVSSIPIYIHIKEIKDYGGRLQQQLGPKAEVSPSSTVNRITSVEY